MCVCVLCVYVRMCVCVCVCECVQATDQAPGQRRGSIMNVAIRALLVTELEVELVDSLIALSWLPDSRVDVALHAPNSSCFLRR